MVEALKRSGERAATWPQFAALCSKYVRGRKEQPRTHYLERLWPVNCGLLSARHGATLGCCGLFLWGNLAFQVGLMQELRGLASGFLWFFCGTHNNAPDRPGGNDWTRSGIKNVEEDVLDAAIAGL